MGIVSIILGIVIIIALISFAIWFAMRTPDHLQGYYSTPVTWLVVVVCIVIIVLVAITLIF